MSRPKGAMGSGTIWEDGSTQSIGGAMKEMMDKVKLPNEMEIDKSEIDDTTRMLNAQNGVGEAKHPSTQPVKTVEQVIKEEKSFTPELKKEMIDLAQSGDCTLEEVSDKKVVFSDANDNKFVILPY